MKNIYNNQAINSSLLYFDPAFQRRKPMPPRAEGERPQRPVFKMPETFTMLKPCKNLGNGSVQLTYHAPEAKSVSVVCIGSSMGAGTFPMTKDEDGYWTVVLENCPIGVHVHRYLVDGVVTLNPLMPFAYATGEPANIFEVVDEDCDWYLMQDVPHGDLRVEYYRSSVTGRWKCCWVYTPPGYEQNPDKRYPVMYLQHGAGEDETGWIDMGKIHYIMDNMLAAGQCREMLVVMNSGFAYAPDQKDSFVGAFAQELVNDCLPFIDGKYRTIADRESRAVVGLSMGGFHAQEAVLLHLDTFAWLGSIISGFMHTRNEEIGRIVADPKALNEKLRLFFATNGEQEPSCEANRATMAALQAAGLTHGRFYSCPGYHELTVCRKSMRELLPLLFQ